MTGVVVTQPREVQSGPFVGSGPLQAELRTRMNPDASRTVPEEKAGEDVAPAVFVTEPLQYTDALPQPRDVQAGPFVGSSPLNAGTDTARSSSDLMTGVVVTQPRDVQAGPFVGSGPLNAGTDTARTSSDLMTGGTITQPR